ncbi:methyl-accepting chemotaxis protein [Cohnella pontilimi]|nr:methyl-accepting chemotaxis protein [Cohnella pontilimi]
MISRLSVRSKLLTMLLIPLLLYAATAVYLIQTQNSNIDKLTKLLYDTTYQTDSLVLNADRDMYQALSAYQTIQAQPAAADRDAAVKDFKENAAQVNDRLKKTINLLNEYGLSDVIKASNGATVKDTITQVVLNFNQWTFAVTEHIDKNEFPADQEKELLAKFMTAREGVNQFGDIIDLYATSKVDEINKQKNTTSISTLSFIVLASVLLIGLGSVIIRQINRVVRAVLERTRRVSEGDLQTPPETRYPEDELGQILQSVDTMTGNMRELIGQISDNARTVAAASEEMSVGARESAASSEHVAQNIQEVTSLVEVQSTIAEESGRAMEQMTIGVQRIAESTGVISEHASQTNRKADEGHEKLLELKHQLDQMTQSIEDLSRSITVLNEKSGQIGEITERITEFANQTGILSLNASIEAARAGEQGRGFAVVAAEIRKLAAGSLESANVINSLIADTRKEINRTSSHMQTTTKQASQSAVIMEDVAQGFQTIVESIQQVAAQIQDTSAVTEQMSASSEEVSASLEQQSNSAREIAGKAQNVAASTEEQLALVDNIARTSERLQDIVGQLNRSVESFKL